MKKYFYLLLSVLFLLACSASKSLYKKGNQLREAGMYKEAAAFYIQSIEKKSTNTDAIIALKQVGQRVLDDYLYEFQSAYNSGDEEKAVKIYREAEAFDANVKRVGVSLSGLDAIETAYQNAKSGYIEKLYRQAQTALAEENFSEAESTLTEIVKLDATYKDAKTLLRNAKAEPAYRSALAEYDNSNWRKAYYSFLALRNNLGEYKEAKELQAICLENGKYSLAILDFSSTSETKAIASSIKGKIQQQLLDAKDPFMNIRTSEIRDKRNPFALFGENNKDYQAYRNEGIQTIVVGKIIAYEEQQGQLSKITKTGYVAYTSYYTDKETGKKMSKTDYKKAYYYEYKQSSRAALQYQYQVIDTQTGKIITSDVVDMTDADQINYAEFSGDWRNLYPGVWSRLDKDGKDDRVLNSAQDKRALETLFRAKKTITPASSMISNMVDQSANRAAIKILEAQNS